MDDEYFAVKVKGVCRYDLPASLAREIGRFIVVWAHFEHYIQTVIWGALKLSPEEGRIAVKEVRVTDRLDILRDLAEVQNLEMDYVLLKEIRLKAEKLSSKRHMLAHCLWQKLDNDWCALVTRGSWQDLPFEVSNYPERKSKNLEPEAHPVTSEVARGWAEAAVELIEDLKKVGDQHKPVPLPEKHKKRSAPKGQ